MGNHILKAHQFKVTFAAGYDDMGKSPTFYTMTPSDGAYADAGTNVRARLYDQRFSNSIWLGKTTGYFEVRVPSGATPTTAAAKFTPVGGTQIALNIKPQSGDSYYFTKIHFGTGAAGTGSLEDTVTWDGGSVGAATHGVDGDAATDTITLENRVRPKPSWSKGRHHYCLDCEIHNVVLAAYVATPKNIITCRIGKLVKFF